MVWAPFQTFVIGVPPPSPQFQPSAYRNRKARFLQNLWLSQANVRARSGKSIVLRSEEREVECRGGRTTYAKTYFNVYQRTAFLQEPHKVRVTFVSINTPDRIVVDEGGGTHRRTRYLRSYTVWHQCPAFRINSDSTHSRSTVPLQGHF
jgi:hypothetical protein